MKTTLSLLSLLTVWACPAASASVMTASTHVTAAASTHVTAAASNDVTATASTHMTAAASTHMTATASTHEAPTAQATDTVRFTTRNVVLEDDPNAGQYNISLYSDDGAWKVQLNYHSDHGMFGTFGNDDFGLQGSGRYYNYARNPQNDMQFYSFTDMLVTISDEVTEYHIEANCLTTNNRRFLIEGRLEVLTPQDTVESDLGYAQRIDNAFYGTHTFHAENDAFRLAYGVVADEPVGTFYTADILMPEIYDKQRDVAVEVQSAVAYHELRADTLWLTLEALGQDLTLYRLQAYNAAHEVEVTAEETVTIEGDIVLQDLTAMYGCFQLAGQSQRWAVAIAFVPDAFEGERREWNMADIFMPYTTMIRLADGYQVPIHDVHVTLEEGPAEGQLTFRAEVMALDGVLYHVTLRTAGPGYLGEPDEEVSLQLSQVALLDYSQPGMIGLGAYTPMQAQLRLYLYANQLDGTYYTDDAVLEMCDVMLVRPDDGTFVFHDAQRVNTYCETDDEGVKHVTVDMLAVDNVLYHVSFAIPALRCLQDCTYTLDDAQLVALQELVGLDTHYTLQLQRLPDDVDDLDVITDGEIFTFGLQPDDEGLAGEYGYSAGTLDEDLCHYLYEQGTEVRLAPVAGTLSVTPVEHITLDDYGYRTTLYDLHFRLVAQNGVLYEGSSHTYLLCIDDEGNLVEVPEPTLSHLTQQLAERGLEVSKVLQQGLLLIVVPTDKAERRYSADGRLMR